MKKFLLLVLLGLVVFAVIYHQRLYLWDPIAKVTRDGVPDTEARVRINYGNDVLLEDASGGLHRTYLVQAWDQKAVAPAHLTCLGSAVCMTDADQAGGDVIVPGSRGRREPFQGVTMTNRRVEFVDENGALVQVTLR